MRKTGFAPALMFVSIICSSLPNIANAADTCVKDLPHPVRHVCGVLFNEQGGQIQNAELILLQNGTPIETVQTGSGRASFDFTKELAAGTYDLTINAPDYSSARFRIGVRKPLHKCSKGVLMITMPVGTGCGNIMYKPARKV